MTFKKTLLLSAAALIWTHFAHASSFARLCDDDFPLTSSYAASSTPVPGPHDPTHPANVVISLAEQRSLIEAAGFMPYHKDTVLAAADRLAAKGIDVGLLKALLQGVGDENEIIEAALCLSNETLAPIVQANFLRYQRAAVLTAADRLAAKGLDLGRLKALLNYAEEGNEIIEAALRLPNEHLVPFENAGFIHYHIAAVLAAADRLITKNIDLQHLKALLQNAEDANEIIEAALRLPNEHLAPIAQTNFAPHHRSAVLKATRRLIANNIDLVHLKARLQNVMDAGEFIEEELRRAQEAFNQQDNEETRAALVKLLVKGTNKKEDSKIRALAQPLHSAKLQLITHKQLHTVYLIGILEEMAPLTFENIRPTQRLLTDVENEYTLLTIIKHAKVLPFDLLDDIAQTDFEPYHRRLVLKMAQNITDPTLEKLQTIKTILMGVEDDQAIKLIIKIAGALPLDKLHFIMGVEFLRAHADYLFVNKENALAVTRDLTLEKIPFIAHLLEGVDAPRSRASIIVGAASLPCDFLIAIEKAKFDPDHRAAVLAYAQYIPDLTPRKLQAIKTLLTGVDDNWAYRLTQAAAPLPCDLLEILEKAKFDPDHRAAALKEAKNIPDLTPEKLQVLKRLLRGVDGERAFFLTKAAAPLPCDLLEIFEDVKFEPTHREVALLEAPNIMDPSPEKLQAIKTLLTSLNDEREARLFIRYAAPLPLELLEIIALTDFPLEYREDVLLQTQAANSLTLAKMKSLKEFLQTSGIESFVKTRVIARVGTLHEASLPLLAQLFQGLSQRESWIFLDASLHQAPERLASALALPQDERLSFLYQTE